MTYTQSTGQTEVPRQQQRRLEEEPAATGWTGWIGFAGVVMILVGIFGAIEGLAALFKDEYFLVVQDRLLVEADFTAWGWTHLILGLIILGAGFGVLVGQMWARVVGVILAVISATVNIAFLAAYPVWSTIIITMDVLVIWALCVHGREMKA